MTQFQQKSFSVNMPTGKDYRDNHDRIFGPRDEPSADTSDPDHFIRQTLESQVREFHDAFGIPCGRYPAVPSLATVKLRLSLIAEEFEELLEACGASGMAYSHHDDEYVADVIENGISRVRLDSVDIVEVADALGDLLYVCMGMALSFGIDLPAVLAEVHRSNMTKLGPDGKPTYREDGKVTKPAGWTPPDIEGVLNRQQPR